MSALIGGVAAAALLAAAPQSSMRPLFTVREFPAFQVLVPTDKTQWCGETAKVTITGQSVDQFVDNQPVIERVVGGLRAVMSFECPQATTIQIAGVVDGQAFYQASASAARNWQLENIERRSAEQLQMIADLDTVASCDDLGAHPDDPEALSEGVADDRLNAGSVVEACTAAIALDGDSPRLRYQLARGLVNEGDFDGAIEQLLPAAEAGHGGALALLADIYLVGYDDVDPDPEMAKGLYEQAAAAGFAPASTMVAQFEDQTRQLAQAEEEERAENARLAREVREFAAAEAAAAAERARAGTLNLQGYETPQFMDAVYSGEYGRSPFNRRFTQVYIYNLASTFRQACRGSFTISELNTWQSQTLQEASTPAAQTQMMTSFFDVIVGIAQGGVPAASAVASNAQSVQSLPAMAAEDAITFLERNACDSRAFTRFTANMREAYQQATD